MRLYDVEGNLSCARKETLPAGRPPLAAPRLHLFAEVVLISLS